MGKNNGSVNIRTVLGKKYKINKKRRMNEKYLIINGYKLWIRGMNSKG